MMYVRLTDLHHSEQRVGVVLEELPECNGLDPGKMWRGDRTGRIGVRKTGGREREEREGARNRSREIGNNNATYMYLLHKKYAIVRSCNQLPYCST